MIPMKGGCPITPRMAMGPEEAEDVVAAEVAVAEDVAVVAVAVRVPVQMGVGTTLRMTVAALIKEDLTPRLMGTLMMTRNSFMIT